MKNLFMSKYMIRIIVVLILIVIVTTILILSALPKEATPTESCKVYVYDTGEVFIKLKKVSDVKQTTEDMEIDGVLYKSGTLVIPGDGSEVYYEYPRRDKVLEVSNYDKN